MVNDDSFTDKLTASLNGDNAPASDAPDKIKVGDKEYTQDELSQLVGLGEIGRELETKWNTKIDRVYPEFTKAQIEKKSLQEERDQFKSELESIKNKVQTEALPEDEAIAEARKAARKIGLVTDEDFAPLLEKSFRTYYTQERAAEKLLDEVNGLQTKIDGKDGRPAFQAREVLEYMQETGITNPELAYKAKYESEIDAWKESQLGKTKKSGFSTIDTSSAGAKQPPKATITRDNLGEAIREALHPNVD